MTPFSPFLRAHALGKWRGAKKKVVNIPLKTAPWTRPATRLGRRVDTPFTALCRMNVNYDRFPKATPPGGGQIEQGRSGMGATPTALFTSLTSNSFYRKNTFNPVPCVFFFGRVCEPAPP